MSVRGADVRARACLLALTAGRADTPDLWFDFLDSTVGPDYPYFATIGNHDNLRWSEYADRLLQRLERINATQYCTGEVGVQAACNWEGLFFLISGIGVRGTGHPEFMDAQLAASNDIWKVCNWHKNQRLYQTGGKRNAVGYEVYDTCRRHGAIVSTGAPLCAAPLHVHIADSARARFASARALVCSLTPHVGL